MNDRVVQLLRDAVEHGERGRAFVADYSFAQYKEYDLPDRPASNEPPRSGMALAFSTWADSGLTRVVDLSDNG